MSQSVSQSVSQHLVIDNLCIILKCFVNKNAAFKQSKYALNKPFLKTDYFT